MNLPVLDELYDDGLTLLDLERRVEPSSCWLAEPKNLAKWTVALADLARLREGWRPDRALLDKAPALLNWRFLGDLQQQPVWLGGTVIGHPRFRAYHQIETSLLIALDTRNLAWMRTISRFYRLGHHGPL
jgi:hypothetical protein